MSDENSTGRRRQVRGKVVSTKMDKTIVVAVERTVKHKKYRKYITRMRTFQAHDEQDSCNVDDVVIIEECRPLSRHKRWTLVERIPAQS
ncbi:MAG: 30S ribosomal protein S17 [Pseudomonadota bacterium]|nr:30S ribosomal protein S17 [Pseudomonadota bacterium]